MADEINYVVGNAATLKIQALWRRSLVRERTYLELKAVWEKIFDPVQQIYYYYNTVTDEASWKRPAPLLWRDSATSRPHSRTSKPQFTCSAPGEDSSS